MNESKPAEQRAAVEAARYALLRRLMPEIEHKMAGAMQPISMIAAMMERRLAAVSADQAALIKSARDLVSLAREAAATRAQLLSWIAPRDEQALAPAGEVVRECLKMVESEFSMRGHALCNEAGELTQPVVRKAMRMVLPATLMALVDASDAPCTVHIRASAEKSDVVLALSRLSGASGSGLPGLGAYRPFSWDDARALAEAEGVVLMHDESSVRLQFSA